MAGKKSASGMVKTPAEIKRAIALREAGYSLATIVGKTGISAATLARHFKKHGIGKGAVSTKAIEAAKQELLTDGFMDTLKAEITSAILDDVAQFKAVRAALAINIEELVNDIELPSHYRARGLTAAATGLRLSQQLIRETLAMNDIEPEAAELPILTVSELTQEDVEDMRRKQLELSSLDEISPEDIEDGEIIEES